MTYRCTNCGYESQKRGSCPDCKKDLEKICPVCREQAEKCTCQSARIQTKGGKLGKARTGLQSH